MSLRGLIGVALLVALGACGAGPVADTGPSFRNPSAPIGVTSRFEEGRFAGPWRVRAALPAGEAFDSINLEDRATGLQMQVTASTCDPAGSCGTFGDTLQVMREGAGKFVIQMPDGVQRRMWVLWIDEGFRTAVVGNPEGTFAWILDRQATGGADRIRAAREILEFNGYDVSALKEAS